jgi:two-component system chemotaxis response regulator CheB
MNLDAHFAWALCASPSRTQRTCLITVQGAQPDRNLWDRRCVANHMNRIIVIAGSAGALYGMRRITAALPPDCRASIFIVLHIGDHRSVLPEVLSFHGHPPAIHPRDGDPIQPGFIYVAPPDHHMVIGVGVIRLNQDIKVHHTRPAADPLFNSAAEAYGERAVGVVLSGGDGDGAIGLKTIKERGGLAMVQDPEEATRPGMPQSALAKDHPDWCLPIAEIARRLAALSSES